MKTIEEIKVIDRILGFKEVLNDPGAYRLLATRLKILREQQSNPQLYFSDDKICGYIVNPILGLSTFREK